LTTIHQTSPVGELRQAHSAAAFAASAGGGPDYYIDYRLSW